MAKRSQLVTHGDIDGAAAGRGLDILLRESAKVLREDLSALRAIATGEPDTKLSAVLSKAVPRLRERRWISVCGCSDGDYVDVTDLGRRILDS